MNYPQYKAYLQDNELAASRREERFVGTCDIHATIVDLAGGKPFPGADGRSFAPMLEQASVPDWPDSIVTEGAGLESAMFTQRMIRKGNVKYVFNCGDLDELYDLAADPHELRNLIHDKGSAKLLEEMRQSLADWMERHEDGLLRQFVRLKME